MPLSPARSVETGDWSPPKYFILRTEGRLAVAVPGVPVRGGVGVAESLPVRHDGP